jgi:hypothetical protein
MFEGLRHHAFVSRDNKQNKVDTGGAGKHILDKPLVAGDIDESKASVAHCKVGESKVDRYSAFTFFREAVRVNASKGPYKRGLSVIYMSRSANDYFHIVMNA